MKKTALITGITGQDGSYLAEQLLEKNYQVVGMVSDRNDIGDHNIAHLRKSLTLETGDLLDAKSLTTLIKKHHPTEAYNLGGLSFVPTSWDRPELTHDVNALGPLRLLTAIRDHSPKTKFFQATSAKIFGNHPEHTQTETTLPNPQDPYSVSKHAAHQSIHLFRSHFQIFAVSGILYNHESPRRGSEFVTRKITQAAAAIKTKTQQTLALGNLDSQADWGYAPDYTHAMWLMLQQDTPDDFLLATGKLHTVRDICDIAFSHLQLNYQDFVTIDRQFYRNAPKHIFAGNPRKAKQKLNWQPSLSFKQMIISMVDTDLQALQN